MQLYLIRHAESQNNARPTYLRVEDPEITPVGRLQAQHLADWLATLKIDAMITSPFLRTLQTALPILTATQVNLDVWHHVFERGGCFRGHDETNFAGAMGMGRAHILRLLAEFERRCRLEASIDDSGWWGGRDRETDQEAEQRAKRICDRLLSTFQNGEVVVLLIHADFKRLMLTEMIGETIDVTGLGPMRNAGITKLNRIDERWQLDYFNSVTHLPAKLITGNEH
ncbi:histidine phosphatase family protein [Roseiconus nitratireducens]|nr:histidine phosphatase family protein [Roseiconus nitratireducens]